MSGARVLVPAVVFRALERKVSKAGKPYAVCTVREQHGETSRFWRATVFSETVMSEIERLQVGEAIALSGAFECELYTGADGKPRINHSMVADGVLSAHAPTKAKTTGRATEASPGAAPSRGTRPIDRAKVDAANARWAARNGASAEVNDDIPF